MARGNGTAMQSKVLKQRTELEHYASQLELFEKTHEHCAPEFGSGASPAGAGPAPRRMGTEQAGTEGVASMRVHRLGFYQPVDGSTKKVHCG